MKTLLQAVVNNYSDSFAVEDWKEKSFESLAVKANGIQSGRMFIGE